MSEWKWPCLPRCSKFCSRKMERPESATKTPEAGRRISPARYCTSTRRPRKAEYLAILFLVSSSGGNRCNSTKGLPPLEVWKKVGKSSREVMPQEKSCVHLGPFSGDGAEGGREWAVLDFCAWRDIVGVRNRAIGSGEQRGGGTKRNRCKWSGGVLRICRRTSARMGGPADERTVLAQAVSLREQRGTLGTAFDGESELLHRSANRGNRVREEPGQGVHGLEPAAQGRSAAGV